MKRAQPSLRMLAPSALSAALVAVLSACGFLDANEIKGPTRITPINIDSVAAGLPDLDTIFAVIDGREKVFGSKEIKILRDERQGAYYIRTKAWTTNLASGNGYEVIYLRLDSITGLGTYRFNAPFVWSTKINPQEPSIYGAQYDRPFKSLPTSYRTDPLRAGGEVRIVKFDPERGIVKGAFGFTAYSSEIDSTISIPVGGFALRLIRD